MFCLKYEEECAFLEMKLKENLHQSYPKKKTLTLFIYYYCYYYRLIYIFKYIY